MLEAPMQYLLILTHAPDAWENDDAARADDWPLYTRALADAGVLVGGAALHSPETATTVQVRSGQTLLTDGPFAETKEHLLGYYVIDVPDLDAALGWAAKVPSVRTGSVEVRPVVAGSDTASVLGSG
jgi:hypothetical protein